MKTVLITLLAGVGLFAQIPQPGPFVAGGGGSGGGGTTCSGIAVTGYVATATSGGANPPCDWEAVGAASVSNAAVANATYLTDSGTANHIIGAPSTAYPAYAIGSQITFLAAATNTGATDINVNSLGVVSVVLEGGNPLGAGAIRAGGIYTAHYNGTSFILSYPQTYSTVNYGARWIANGVIGTGLVQDDGVNGVGINGPASTQSGLQEIFSVTNNIPGFNLAGLHNNNNAGVSEWEIYGTGGSAHIALGLNNDPVTGYAYLNAGLGNLGMFFGTSNGSFVFNRVGTASGPSSDRVFTIMGTGGVTMVENTALGSPGAGFGNVWFDSTDHALHAKNGSSVISTTVVANACAGQVVGSISAAGIITCVAGSSGGVPTSRTISTTLPLTGGGDLSANRTFGINAFTGDSGSGGLAGSVPAPASGDAAAGKFLSAGGNWTVPAGGGGGGANVPTVAISGATATLFAQCATGGCNVSRGSNQIDHFTATNTLTAPGTGTGIVVVYWDGGGCNIASNSTLVNGSGSGPCAVSGISGSGLPNNLTGAICTLTYNAGAWTDYTNYQPTASNPPVVTAGAGISSTLSSGSLQLAIDNSVVMTQGMTDPAVFNGPLVVNSSSNFAGLPACDSGHFGWVLWVLDSTSNPGWGGAVTTGGGGFKLMINCDGVGSWRVVGL